MQIVTVQIKEEIYYLLECCGQFPEQQKGGPKATQGSDDHRDQRIFKEIKTGWKNLLMAWIDYKMSDDIAYSTNPIVE